MFSTRAQQIVREQNPDRRTRKRRLLVSPYRCSSGLCVPGFEILGFGIMRIFHTKYPRGRRDVVYRRGTTCKCGLDAKDGATKALKPKRRGDSRHLVVPQSKEA